MPGNHCPFLKVLSASALENLVRSVCRGSTHGLGRQWQACLVETSGTMAGENLREFARAPVSGTVKFFERNRASQAVSTEISGGGIFLRTGAVLAEGAMVTVRVTLPGACGEHSPCSARSR